MGFYTGRAIKYGRQGFYRAAVYSAVRQGICDRSIYELFRVNNFPENIIILQVKIIFNEKE